MNIQLEELKSEIDQLQKLYGSEKLNSVYGAGCINNPDILFLFMNPTGRNISSDKNQKGIRACWVGTKNIWKIFYCLNLLNEKTFQKTQDIKNWTDNFSVSLYKEISNNSIYITNLAKCSQDDARSLSDKVFKAYLENTLKEIYIINPKIIISFGNQVSSILLNKKIEVSKYIKNNDKEILTINNKKFNVYPCYYPIGQGMRNTDKAIKRLKDVIKILVCSNQFN